MHQRRLLPLGEAAAKARDDAVFDPRNPAYAYRGRAQPNIPRASSQPVPTLARRTAPASSSLAPPPHGPLPGERPRSSPSGRALAVLPTNGFASPPPALDPGRRSDGRRRPSGAPAASIGPGFGRSEPRERRRPGAYLRCRRRREDFFCATSWRPQAPSVSRSLTRP